MQLFGGYQRKSFLQVKTHLVTKTTDSAGTGTVGFYRPLSKIYCSNWWYCCITLSPESNYKVR